MPTPTDLGDPPPTVLVSHHCHPTLIDDRFRSLIDAANAASSETLPGLVDVGLQGLVARGEAVVGQSDIDFTASLIVWWSLSRVDAVNGNIQLTPGAPITTLAPLETLDSVSKSMFPTRPCPGRPARVWRTETSARLLAPRAFRGSC
jgi:hypothetical protein